MFMLLIVEIRSNSLKVLVYYYIYMQIIYLPVFKLKIKRKLFRGDLQKIGLFTY